MMQCALVRKTPPPKREVKKQTPVRCGLDGCNVIVDDKLKSDDGKTGACACCITSEIIIPVRRHFGAALMMAPEELIASMKTHGAAKEGLVASLLTKTPARVRAKIDAAMAQVFFIATGKNLDLSQFPITTCFK